MTPILIKGQERRWAVLRGLKIALIVYGAIGILVGLALIIAPNQLSIMMGIGEIPDVCSPAMYTMAIVGISFIAAGVFLIVAGRDPLRHINWVKFAILWAILAVVAGFYSIIQDYVDFSQIGMTIILDGVFAVAFLALYPYRLARSAE